MAFRVDTSKSWKDVLGDAIFATTVILDVIDAPVSPGPDVSIGGAAAKTALKDKAAAKSGAARTTARVNPDGKTLQMPPDG